MSDGTQMPPQHAFADDGMFMDDLTFTSPPSMVGTPGDSSGLGHSPASDNLPTSAHTSASAIPIKKEKGRMSMMAVAHGAPASAPQNHFDMREHEGEFAYVQRRIRKTSVDERRVSGEPHHRPLEFEARVADSPRSRRNEEPSSLLSSTPLRAS